jgi:hypothetical protein
MTPSEDGGAGRAEEELALLDISWLLPDLAVSGRFRPEVAEHLACRLGIRRIVDLRAEDKDEIEILGRCQIALLHLPTPDMYPPSQERLWEGVQWVREGLSRGEKVLIHCEHGIGRSVLLACCVLVSLGHTPVGALEIAKRARWKASPSPEQLHALLRWSADWHLRNRVPCPPDTWDDLARVAYRNLQDHFDAERGR